MYFFLTAQSGRHTNLLLFSILSMSNIKLFESKQIRTFGMKQMKKPALLNVLDKLRPHYLASQMYPPRIMKCEGKKIAQQK